MTFFKYTIRTFVNRFLRGRLTNLYRYLGVRVTDKVFNNFVTYDPATDIGRALFYSGEFERKELELCSKYISETDVILDVGANIGLHSLYFSKLACQGKIVAFEPSLETFLLLSQNVKNKNNIVIINTAISNCGGILDFFQASDNAYSSLIDTKRKSIVDVGKVPCFKLDDVVSGLELQRVDFVKIDVEGLEGNVLNGMQRIIEKFHPIIFCEIYKGIASNQNPDETIRAILDRNYEAYVMEEGALVKYKEHNDRFYNYLFLPKHGA